MTRHPGPTRVLQVGASFTEVCGVRGFAEAIDIAFSEREVVSRSVWAEWATRPTLHELMASTRSWVDDVEAVVHHWAPDAILWNYSVFTYSWRGLPLAVPAISRRLSRLGPPVTVVLHEVAVPFGRRRWRDLTWAVAQRAALAALVKRLPRLVVTTESRATWLSSRRWIPSAQVYLTPIPSHHQPPPDRRPSPSDRRVGVLGFGSDEYEPEPVVEAVSTLRSGGVPVELVLIGSPGADSKAGRSWRRAAEVAGCLEAVTFTGVLPAEELRQALAELPVFVYPQREGPSSRRTVLANLLAFGKPVVALDGPERWDRLVDEGAVAIVPPSCERVAEVLRRLLTDDALRARQGAAAERFHDRWSSPSRVAESLKRFLASAEGGSDSAAVSPREMTPEQT